MTDRSGDGGSADTIGRTQQGGQRVAQSLLVKVAQDATAFHQADRAGLLADHDGQCIGLLGDPDSGAVSRPEPLTVHRRLG